MTDKPPKTEKTDAEWREQLTEEQYRIARGEGTELAFTSPLNNEKREGEYHCVGCGAVVFLSDAKYDSGSGWPSFFEPADSSALDMKTDHKLVAPRTEVHCAKCGAHMGHVFPDGPQPTGLRYCINGSVLDFQPSND